jgi:hypothetical protein
MEKRSYELDDFNDDYNEPLSSYERRPPSNDYDVFKQRNDPEPLIEDFYLYLTNQIINRDPETNQNEPYLRIGKPLLNKQGVRDLVNWMRSFINSHSVQTNVNNEALNRIMRHMSDDLAMFMVNSIEDWKIEERYVRSIHNTLVAQADTFLRRGLDDKEREHYSQEMKHEYSTQRGGEKKRKALSLPSNIKNMFSN